MGLDAGRGVALVARRCRRKCQTKTAITTRAAATIAAAINPIKLGERPSDDDDDDDDDDDEASLFEPNVKKYEGEAKTQNKMKEMRRKYICQIVHHNIPVNTFVAHKGSLTLISTKPITKSRRYFVHLDSAR